MHGTVVVKGGSPVELRSWADPRETTSRPGSWGVEIVGLSAGSAS